VTRNFKIRRWRETIKRNGPKCEGITKRGGRIVAEETKTTKIKKRKEKKEERKLFGNSRGCCAGTVGSLAR
jgi:hypothetical protein